MAPSTQRRLRSTPCFTSQSSSPRTIPQPGRQAGPTIVGPAHEPHADGAQSAPASEQPLQWEAWTTFPCAGIRPICFTCAEAGLLIHAIPTRHIPIHRFVVILFPLPRNGGDAFACVVRSTPIPPHLSSRWADRLLLTDHRSTTHERTRTLCINSTRSPFCPFTQEAGRGLFSWKSRKVTLHEPTPRLPDPRTSYRSVSGSHVVQ